jgi:hypothetical protein
MRLPSLLLLLSVGLAGCSSLPLEIDPRRAETCRFQRQEFPAYGFAVTLPVLDPATTPTSTSGDAGAPVLYQNLLLEWTPDGFLAEAVKISEIQVQACTAESLRAARLAVPAPGKVVVANRILLDGYSNYAVVRAAIVCSAPGKMALVLYTSDLTREAFKTIRDRDLVVWQDDAWFRRILESMEIRDSSGHDWARPGLVLQPIQYAEAVAGSDMQNLRQYDPLQYSVLDVLELHRLIYDKTPLVVRKPIGVLP